MIEIRSQKTMKPKKFEYKTANSEKFQKFRYDFLARQCDHDQVKEGVIPHYI